MHRLLKRLAVTFLLLGALANGLAGPWAHGHAADGVPGPVQEMASQAVQIAADEAEHLDCNAAEHESAQLPQHPGGHSHGKAASDGICSGALSCCGAVAAYGLPDVAADGRTAARAVLPPTLCGMTPPVGERPPLLLHA